MSDIQILLTQCRDLGIALAPGSEGKLRITPAGVLPHELRTELKQRKAEILALLQSPWPCRHCGQHATIESIGPSLDGQRLLTFWHCEPCQTWGVTPDTLRESPVWVPKTMQ
jgi:hypothetical protein